MMKKFLACACCILPLGTAVAATSVIDPATNPESNVMSGLSVAADSAVRVISGNGLVLDSGGLSASSLYIGTNYTGSMAGQIFVETSAGADYTIRSNGDIDITGLLDIASGTSLGIASKTTGNTIAQASFGSVNATGALVMNNIGVLNTGNITSQNTLNLSANSFHVAGTINSITGNTTINVVDDFVVDGDFIVDGGAQTNINVNSLSVTNFQNKSGSVEIFVAGDNGTGSIVASGNVENSGTSMSITGGEDVDLLVAGTMKNDNNDGTMTLNLRSLKINGGSGTNASFVNAGNLEIVVTEDVYLENGFDLSSMLPANTFSLHTGTLDIGGDADAWLQLFANNKLAAFELVVNNGTIDVDNIINGQGNSDANMTLKAQGISADLVQNYGDVLSVYTTLDGFDADSIFGAAGSTTTIVANTELNVSGDVSNNGTMTLNGNEIDIVDVANSGTLTIAAQTDPTGLITIQGNVANSAGTTTISARDVSIAGVVSTTGGTINILGSDVNGGNPIYVGGINALGGVTNLDALIGSSVIDGDLLVSGGAFNVGANTYTLQVIGGTQIDGDFTFSATPAASAGNVNVANSGANAFTLLTSSGQIYIGGSVVAEDDSVARTGNLIADVIKIGTDVSVANQGYVAFGDTSSSTLNIDGDMVASSNLAGTKVGTIEIYSGATTLNSLSGSGKFIMHGDSVVSTGGGINISNGVLYDGTDAARGMIINGTNAFTLQTTATGQDVDVVGGMSIANGTLNIVSVNDANISGSVNVNSNTGVLNVNAENDVVFNNGTITASNGGVVDIKGLTIETSAIDILAGSGVSIGDANTASVTTNALVSNAGTLDILADTVTMSALKSTGGATSVTANNGLQIDSVDVGAGNVVLSGDTFDADSMTLSGGNTTIASDTIALTGNIAITAGDLNQGGATGTTGTLILTDSGTLSANNLTVSSGKLFVNGADVAYNITNTATFNNGIEVTGGGAIVNAANIVVGDIIDNNADLTLNTTNNLNLGVINNTGNLVLTTAGGALNAASLTNNSGTTKITSNSTTLSGALTLGGILYQNNVNPLMAGDMNITSNDHILSASNIVVGGITQSTNSSVMTIKSGDVQINGDVVAKDLRIMANPSTSWLNVDITGNVSGGVDFVGMEHMHIGRNYTYDDNSMLHVAVLPTPGVTINSTTYNYWSNVSLNDDNTFGRITNATDGNAAPLISVDGQFIYNVSNIGPELSGTPLVNPQIGIDIFDMVDSGTAIWLLHADGGLVELADKIRNLNVNFCNADGTRCFKYFDNTIAANAAANQTESNLPAYLSVRDVNEDGTLDSIYVVFDSRFGGPVEVFKIQPIVARVDDHTGGEYDSAGGLDEMIAGGLYNAKFYGRTPIEAIPVAFRGTNLEELATELYNRMEQYVVDRDGTALARFSRLTQPRELEQVAGSVALNEHTNFRDFEDHMLDEFIWNRHRSLKKAWVDVDYGLFYQNISDGKRANGDRFSIAGGYDWQHSSTLILGVAGHVSHMSADDTDAMDLTYKPGQRVDGNVSLDVANTNVGIGAYLMKILGTKTRLYGNAFLDLHLLDVSRDQNFVSHIDGSGSAFSLISEWGYLHDWLNQYIVGNLYARVGYNFGFSVRENAGGDEYMHLQSDGYMILTPGYSLIAQKRIYPSSWFQIRPYASIGIEYDVLGMPDFAEFKFGPAKKYTKYDIDIDPLWANIGGGVELLSASGFQIGLDYRYQYNDAIHLHKVRVAGSYRF